jgi:hypothetical protein
MSLTIPREEIADEVLSDSAPEGSVLDSGIEPNGIGRLIRIEGYPGSDASGAQGAIERLLASEPVKDTGLIGAWCEVAPKLRPAAGRPARWARTPPRDRQCPHPRRGA